MVRLTKLQTTDCKLFRGVVKIYGLPCQWQICAKCQDFDEEFVLMFGSLNDAVFRCPASMAGKGCGANDLCFRDLILGTCCARAMRTHYDIGLIRLSVINLMIDS